MRRLIFIFFLLVSIGTYAQKNYLLIGRNLGTITLPDSNIIRSFGFARTLNENPNVPGPTIYVKEGDSLTIDFFNVSQGAGHTIHLHGLDVDQDNDGVPHLSFTVEHMEHGYYRFKAPHPGTYLYHCHVISSIHVQAGMYGMIIVHPKQDSLITWIGGYPFAKEYAFLASEIDTFWHQDSVLNQGHDHMINTARIPKYKPQFFLLNGHADAHSLKADSMNFMEGEKVFLRLANIGYLANRYQFPEYLNAKIISSDGRPLPLGEDQDSLWIFPGERYGVLIDASSQGADSIQISYRNMNTLKQEGNTYLQVNVQGVLGLPSKQDENLTAYPNPGNGKLNIRFVQVQAISSVTVYDAQGKTFYPNYRQNGPELEIDFSELRNGLYFIHLLDDNGQSFHLNYVKDK